MLPKHKNILISMISIVLAIFANYMGYVNGPFSITFTPIYIGIVSVLVIYKAEIDDKYRFILFCGFIVFYDLLVKFFAGGTHDSEGSGWIMGFNFLGLIIAFFIIIFKVFFDVKEKKKYLLYLVLAYIFLILYSFSTLQVGRTVDY